MLVEFAATLLHKLVPAAQPPEVASLLDVPGSVKLVRPDDETVRRAVETRGRCGIHFYDGMIVAAAEQAGFERIWSEHLNSGQKYLGIAGENPFR